MTSHDEAHTSNSKPQFVLKTHKSIVFFNKETGLTCFMIKPVGIAPQAKKSWIERFKAVLLGWFRLSGKKLKATQIQTDSADNG